MELMIICSLLFWCFCHPSSNPKELKKRKRNYKYTIDFPVAQMGLLLSTIALNLSLFEAHKLQGYRPEK
jgi:hypothetical protein